MFTETLRTGSPYVCSSAQTLYGVLEDVSALRPRAPAIINGDFTLSYAGLKVQVDRMARALHHCGVKKGDRIAILSTPRPEVNIVLLAAARLGAIYLGLGTRMTRNDLDVVLKDAQPKVVFGLASANGKQHECDLVGACRQAGIQHCVILRPQGDGVADELLDFAGQACASTAPVLSSEGVAPFDAVAIVYTSGSTGPPKGAMISHHGLLISVGAILRRIGIRELRALAILPIDHVGFLSSDFARVLLAGGVAIQLPFYDADRICRTIERHRVTSWIAIPTMLQRLVECEAFEHCDLSSLEILWWAGPMSDRTFRAVRERWDCLAVAYGMTEASGGFAFSPPQPTDEDLRITTGIPFDTIQVRIDESVGGVDGGGEIQLRGPQLMMGYWNKPEATRIAFTADGWFRTGDLGRFIGNSLQVIGRYKELIRSGGYNISPAEIEAVMHQHPNIASAVVVGVPDEVYGEAVHACWVAVPEGAAHQASHDDEALRAWLRERLAGYKVPKRFWRVNAMPLLANGKIDRKRVATQVCDAAAAEAAAPIQHLSSGAYP